MLNYLGNQILLKSLRLAALAVICGSLASADVLYWIDLELGGATNAIPGGITKAGLTGVAATSALNFDQQLTAGPWSAVIIAVQANTFTAYLDPTAAPNLLTDLTAYVNGGGRLIGSDWANKDNSIHPDLAFYSLFQAAFVDANNSSVTNDGNALFNAIAGNIGLTNPGWGTFDQSFSPLAGGIGIGPSGINGGFGIIRGNGGQTFLNGPLPDAYTNLAEGEQLIANELTADVVESPVPEPGTFALLLGAVGGLMLVRQSRKQIH